MSWLAPAMMMMVPLAAALVIIAAPARQAKWIALAASTAVFFYSVVLALAFDNWTDGGFWPGNASIAWLDHFGVNFSLGADSVSMLLVLLTTLLMPLCIWGSFTAITDRLKEYYGWMLAIEAAMIGVFIARDVIFFYVCFEFTLIPMYFLIALWGGGNRARASIKFFLFTFTGSVVALAGLVYVAWFHRDLNGVWTFDIQTLTQTCQQLSEYPVQFLWFDLTRQHLVLLALLAGFAVKVPLFPVHTWLPLAHTEAPTAASVILAAVLLKLGTYGLYRFALPMAPAAVVDFAPAIAVISIIGILYAALICWVQHDIKRLIAYSSVSHLGFCVLGLVALNPLGLQGSVMYMLNHGLSTGALFFLVGMIYERYHTRDMDKIRGLARRMPVWAFFMVFFVLSSVGLPGLNGFVGEFLCLIGAFTATADAQPYPGVLGPWYAAVAAVGMILAAMYLLIMVGKVVFGELKEPLVRGRDHDDAHNKLPPDLSWREIGILAPLAVLCVYIGLQPKPMTDVMQGSIDNVLAQYPATVEQYLAADETPSPLVQATEYQLIQDPHPDPLPEGEGVGTDGELAEVEEADGG